MVLSKQCPQASGDRQAPGITAAATGPRTMFCVSATHKVLLVTQRLLPPRNKSTSSSSVFKYKGEYGSKWPWCKETQRHMAYLQRHVPPAICPGPSINNPNKAQGVVLTTKTCILKVNCWSHNYINTVSVSLGLIISTNPQLKDIICPYFFPYTTLHPKLHH